MPFDLSSFAGYNDNPLTIANSAVELRNKQQQNQLLQTQNQRQQIGLSTDQATLAMQQYNQLNKVIGDLAVKANSKSGISQNEMIGEAANALKQGTISSDGFNDFVANLGEDTPQNNAATVAKLQYKIQDAAKQHAITYGQNAQVSTGGQTTQGVLADPMNQGGFTPATTEDMTVTPAEKMAGTEGIKNGVPVTVPNANRFDQYGNPLNAGSPQNNAPTQSAPQGNGAQGISTIPGDVNAPSKAATAANAGAGNSGLGAGEMQTKYAPGTEGDMKSQALQGAELQKSADAVPNRKALLGELEGIVKSGDVNLGPGSNTWTGILSGVQRLYGGDSESVSKYDTFNKLSTQLAQQQFQTLGGTGTDTKLGSAISANPNTALSNKSNADIIALLKGNEDAIKIKNSEWQKWKEIKGAGSYSAFSSDFNNKFDPRVFQAQYMAPADKKAMLDSLSDVEFSKYKNDYDVAHKNGWLKK